MSRYPSPAAGLIREGGNHSWNSAVCYKSSSVLVRLIKPGSPVMSSSTQFQVNQISSLPANAQELLDKSKAKKWRIFCDCIHGILGKLWLFQTIKFNMQRSNTIQTIVVILINTVHFLKIPHNETPHSSPVGVSNGVSSEFNISSMFCHHHCIDVFNIVLSFDFAIMVSHCMKHMYLHLGFLARFQVMHETVKDVCCLNGFF